MEQFWNNVLAVPFYYVEVLLAGLAAISFLVFLRGFLGGIGNVFTMNGHDEHLLHARTRSVWGVLLLAFLFVLWEILRMVASWLGGPMGDTTLGMWFVIAIAATWLFLFIKKKLFSGGGGGGH
ncbi:MAG: hypothetical protein NT019_03300 [Candidatus Adlerbacteria bacterium]|nr:hypothetical protein [Candidatus Adlerbacteria bacterium]